MAGTTTAVAEVLEVLRELPSSEPRGLGSREQQCCLLGHFSSLLAFHYWYEDLGNRRLTARHD